jgi:hypothetical protein
MRLFAPFTFATWFCALTVGAGRTLLMGTGFGEGNKRRQTDSGQGDFARRTAQ